MLSAPVDHDPQPPPTIAELFLAFFGIAIVGFGGVLPWARRMLVEQRRWMTGQEFAEALSLAQFLPGGNILNLAVAVGQRFQGPAGSLAALTGLLLGPFFIVILLGMLYLRYGRMAIVHDALAGIAAAAAGLILSMAAKMAEPLFRQRAAVPIGVAAVAFLAIAVAELPLVLVLTALAPASVLLVGLRRP